MIDAVIFDMDGTLVDSERLSQIAWQDSARELGLELPGEVSRTFLGGAKSRTIRLLEAHFGNSDDAVRCFAVHADVAQRLMDRELVAKPGAHEALSDLCECGIRIAIASSSPAETIERRLRLVGMWGMFDVVVCGDDVARSKPEPDIFLEAARRLGIAPAHCVVVEDSYNGVRAGHAAGMVTVMVPDLLPPTDEIRDLADAVIPSLRDLGALIDGSCIVGDRVAGLR